MYDRRSIYALNKKNPDAIVLPDADGNLIDHIKTRGGQTMNIRPTVDFDDKYLNAKCKVIECIKALNQLTPEQNQQLARECFASMGMAMSLEQFIHHMENGGQV